MSLITHLDAHTVFDTGWDFDGLLDLGPEFSLTMTVTTLFYDTLSRTLTGTTRLRLFHNTEYRLNTLAYLSAPMTCRTRLSLSSLPTAVMTLCISIELDLARCSSNRIFE